MKSEHQIEYKNKSRAQWHTLSVPPLGGQRQEDHCEVKASLVHKVSSRMAGTKESDQNKQTKKYQLSSGH